MNIDRETVLRIAELARIELKDTEVEMFAKQLGDILKYVDQLQGVDDQADPFSFEAFLPNVMRTDEVIPSIPVEDAMKNAPERAGRFFRVPRIIP